MPKPQKACPICTEDFRRSDDSHSYEMALLHKVLDVTFIKAKTRVIEACRLHHKVTNTKRTTLFIHSGCMKNMMDHLSEVQRNKVTDILYNDDTLDITTVSTIITEVVNVKPKASAKVDVPPTIEEKNTSTSSTSSTSAISSLFKRLPSMRKKPSDSSEKKDSEKGSLIPTPMLGEAARINMTSSSTAMLLGVPNPSKPFPTFDIVDIPEVSCDKLRHKPNPAKCYLLKTTRQSSIDRDGYNWGYYFFKPRKGFEFIKNFQFRMEAKCENEGNCPAVKIIEVSRIHNLTRIIYLNNHCCFQQIDSFVEDEDDLDILN